METNHPEIKCRISVNTVYPSIFCLHMTYRFHGASRKGSSVETINDLILKKINSVKIFGSLLKNLLFIPFVIILYFSYISGREHHSIDFTCESAP